MKRVQLIGINGIKVGYFFIMIIYNLIDCILKISKWIIKRENVGAV